MAINSAIITKIVLKNEPAITFLVEIIILPPIFLPRVSQQLNINIVEILYHFDCALVSKNDQYESKKTPAKTMNVAMKT